MPIHIKAKYEPMLDKAITATQRLHVTRPECSRPHFNLVPTESKGLTLRFTKLNDQTRDGPGREGGTGELIELEHALELASV